MKNWLFCVMSLVIAMIVLGGATRLTNSGLSITEWAPIKGAIPPLSDAQWQIEFEKYKQIPEFLAEHPDMDVESFKRIYFWEWAHRQLGRLIGLAYAVPFFIFAFRRRIPRGKMLRFASILVLIGIQGAIGWWMVASGLTDNRVDVSQYRLAVHLGMAFLILGLLFWLWRDVARGWPSYRSGRRCRKRSVFLSLLVFVQIIAGAFVAGTKSGQTYNTWPLMDGGFIPGGYGAMSPLWKNLFENAAAIQFNHRLLAYLILVLAVWVGVTAWKNLRLRRDIIVLSAILVFQVALGIWTLLAVAPLSLSLLHQFTAIWLFLASIHFTRSVVTQAH